MAQSYPESHYLLDLKGYSCLREFALSYKDKFKSSEPFPHIVIDGLIKCDYLESCASEFPDLSLMNDVIRHSGRTDEKLASPRGDSFQPPSIKALLAFLNSSEFLDFLQTLSSISEPLIPDPHFVGGGLHQIKRGGFLKVHADFAKHPETKLDRRLNLLLYLNKNWKSEYGGCLELYESKDITSKKKILPIFNRMVIFNTNDYTYHGHPDPLDCPKDKPRNSLALYYFSNGRPREELRSSIESRSTIYRARKGERFKFEVKDLLLQFIPPISYPIARSIRNYIAKKKS